MTNTNEWHDKDDPVPEYIDDDTVLEVDYRDSDVLVYYNYSGQDHWITECIRRREIIRWRFA